MLTRNIFSALEAKLTENQGGGGANIFPNKPLGPVEPWRCSRYQSVTYFWTRGRGAFSWPSLCVICDFADEANRCALPFSVFPGLPARFSCSPAHTPHVISPTRKLLSPSNQAHRLASCSPRFCSLSQAASPLAAVRLLGSLAQCLPAGPFWSPLTSGKRAGEIRKDLSPGLERAYRPDVSSIWTEYPANPVLELLSSSLILFIYFWSYCGGRFNVLSTELVLNYLVAKTISIFPRAREGLVNGGRCVFQELPRQDMREEVHLRVWCTAAGRRALHTGAAATHACQVLSGRQSRSSAPSSSCHCPN